MTHKKTKTITALALSLIIGLTTLSSEPKAHGQSPREESIFSFLSDTNAPNIPTGLRATAKDQTILIEWDSVTKNTNEEITRYRIYPRLFEQYEQQEQQNIQEELEPAAPKEIPLRETDRNKGEFTYLDAITVENATSHEFQNLENNRVYYFSISALDNSGNESKRTYEIAVTPLEAEKPVRAMRVSAWMPTNQDREDAIKSLRNNLDVYHTISFFWYNLEPDGTLSTKGGSPERGLIDLAQKNGIKVVPTITNNFDPEKTSTILNNDKLFEKLVKTIIDEVTINNYDGIDIDFEAVKAEDKERFTAFISELSTRLHARNKELIVTLQPKRSDRDNWDGPGASDYDAIGRLADRVRIMTYDYSRVNTKPGPIAPIDWMHTVMSYTKSKIPAEKIETGIPFYGYTWCQEQKGKNSAVVWDGVQNLLNTFADQNPQIEWDESAHEPYFRYRDEDCDFLAYFQNARSISSKLDVALEQGVGGIAIWRIGSEDPGYFEKIREKFHFLPTSPQNLHIKPGNKSIHISWDAPTNESTKGYKVYYGFAPGSYPEVEDIGLKTDFNITGLINDRPLFITINAYDEFGNMSKRPGEISATPTNNIPPARIEDLRVTDTFEYSANLEWTAPGDDDQHGIVQNYDIRFAEFEITESTWDKAHKYPFNPKPTLPGQLQRFQIRDLESGVPYYFAIKAIDEAHNHSPLSNIAATETIDIIPPATPTELFFENNDAQVTLTWSLNTEKDFAGYRIYYKPEQEAHYILRFVGNTNTATLSYLTNEQKYHVTVAAIDFKGNESEKSEIITVRPRNFEPTQIPYFTKLDNILMNPGVALALTTTTGQVVQGPQQLLYLTATALLVATIISLGLLLYRRKNT
jgi:spore germination protein